MNTACAVVMRSFSLGLRVTCPVGSTCEAVALWSSESSEASCESSGSLPLASCAAVRLYRTFIRYCTA